MAESSEPAPSKKKKKYCVKFSDSWSINYKISDIPERLQFCFVYCAEAISVLHMEEKMILIDTGTPQSTRDMWVLRNNKEN